MLRKIQRAQQCSPHGYVCLSCRVHLQSYRRFQSTAAIATDSGGGGDDWFSNFNNLISNDDYAEIKKSHGKTRRERMAKKAAAPDSTVGDLRSRMGSRVAENSPDTKQQLGVEKSAFRRSVGRWGASGMIRPIRTTAVSQLRQVDPGEMRFPKASTKSTADAEQAVSSTQERKRSQPGIDVRRLVQGPDKDKVSSAFNRTPRKALSEHTITPKPLQRVSRMGKQADAPPSLKSDSTSAKDEDNNAAAKSVFFPSLLSHRLTADSPDYLSAAEIISTITELIRYVTELLQMKFGVDMDSRRIPMHPTHQSVGKLNEELNFRQGLLRSCEAAAKRHDEFNLAQLASGSPSQQSRALRHTNSARWLTLKELIRKRDGESNHVSEANAGGDAAKRHKTLATKVTEDQVSESEAAKRALKAPWEPEGGAKQEGLIRRTSLKPEADAKQQLKANRRNSRSSKASSGESSKMNDILGELSKDAQSSKTPKSAQSSMDELLYGFANSPMELAEQQEALSATAVAKPSTESMEPESNQGPNTSGEEKGAAFDDLKQDLSQDLGRGGPPRKSTDAERMGRVTRNVQALQPSLPGVSSAEVSDGAENASQSLADLHANLRESAAPEQAADSTEEITGDGKILLRRGKIETSDDKAAWVARKAKALRRRERRPELYTPGGKLKSPKSRAAIKRRLAAEEAAATPSAEGVNSQQPSTTVDNAKSDEHQPMWKVLDDAKRALGKPAEAADPSPEKQAAVKAEEEQKPELPPLDMGDAPPPTVMSVRPSDLHVNALNLPQPPVPGLAYGLDRVLFNQGVYWLQDPSSRVYNFDPYLEHIMPPTEFDFGALKEYKTSSEDKALSDIAMEHGKKYIGSTSSMTSSLAHFHYLLSNWRPLNLDMLSRKIPEKVDTVTKINRAPAAIFLRWKPESNTYAIDADKEFDSPNVLMMLGKSMEKLLTMPTDDFEKYRKSDPREVSEAQKNEPEAFEYTTMGDLLMRSQLDAYDPRLPGNGMFDLKTRACLPVRMSSEDFEPMLGYEIHTLQGRWESYEREFYDMIRATMLKYSLQARMGRMAGILAAYHNVERIFGFQYIPIADMDRALHGQTDSCLGDQEFKLSLELFNKVLEKATARFPEKSLRVHFECSQEGLGLDEPTTVMSVFAEPMEEEEVEGIQNSSKERVREFEREVMGMNKKVAEVEEVEKEDGVPTTYPPDNRVGEVEEAEPAADEEVQEEEDAPTTYPPQAPGAAPSQDAVATNPSSISVGEVKRAESASEEPEEDEVAPTTYPPVTPEPTPEEPEPKVEEKQESDEAPTTYPPVTPEPASTSSSTSATSEFITAAAVDLQHAQAVLGEAEAQGEVDAPTTYPPATPEPIADKIEKNFAPQAEELEDAPEDVERRAEEEEEAQEPDAAPTTYPPVTPEPAPSEPKQVSKRKATKSSTDAADPAFLSSLSQQSSGPIRPLFAATLMTKNQVNGVSKPRPERLTPDDQWSIEYLLTEYPSSEATWARYNATKARRKDALVREQEDDDEALRAGMEGDSGGEDGSVVGKTEAKGKGKGVAVAKKAKAEDSFIEFLAGMARRGKEWRKARDEEDEEKGLGKVVFESTSEGGKGQPGAANGPEAVGVKDPEPKVGDVDDYMGWLYGEGRGRRE